MLEATKQDHDQLGYIPREYRAMQACPDHELQTIMTNLEHHFAFYELPFDYNWSARVLLDALMMNPLAVIRNGAIDCPDELKAPFVETFTKTLIARLVTLDYGQRTYVSKMLCSPLCITMVVLKMNLKFFLN